MDMFQKPVIPTIHTPDSVHIYIHVPLRILSILLYSTMIQNKTTLPRHLYVPHQKIIKRLFVGAELLAAHRKLIADSIVIRW